MRGSRALRAADVQRLLNMIIDACTGFASPVQRKQALLATLCETFRARVGEIVEVAEGPDPRQRRFTSFIDHGWDSPQQSRDYVVRCETINLTDPLSEHTFARSDDAFNIRREDIVEDHAWYQSPYLNEVLRPADLDPVLGCYRRFRVDPDPRNGRAAVPRPGAAGHCEGERGANGIAEGHSDGEARDIAASNHSPRIVGIGVGLHRAFADESFTPRDVALLSHFNNALIRLYPLVLFDEDERIWRTLPRRMREMLDCLLQGLSDKAIAERMRLSPHTVHDYAAELYKRFAVDGRSALLAKVLGRNGRG